MQSHRSTRTLLAFILIVSAIASSTQSFLQVAHAAPAPTVTVTSPGPTAIGKPAQFVVSFSNTGVTAPTTGYGPYLDLFMPRGADDDIAPLGTGSVTPYLFNVTKSYVGPEDETATGPNFQVLPVS